jgi:hypothetical protein
MANNQCLVIFRALAMVTLIGLCASALSDMTQPMIQANPDDFASKQVHARNAADYESGDSETEVINRFDFELISLKFANFDVSFYSPNHGGISSLNWASCTASLLPFR